MSYNPTIFYVLQTHLLLFTSGTEQIANCSGEQFVKIEKALIVNIKVTINLQVIWMVFSQFYKRCEKYKKKT